MSSQRAAAATRLHPLSAQHERGEERPVLYQEAFQRMIAVERKRSERSRKPFLLMLVEMDNGATSETTGMMFTHIVAALLAATRETDVIGWYKDQSVVGVMLTELVIDEKTSFLSTMFMKVSQALRDNLDFEQFNQISISFHLFPDDWKHSLPQHPRDPTLYPDLIHRDESNRAFRVIKRVMDFLGSLAALILFSPLFLIVTIAIKATSTGPTFFRQQRVGQYGKSFVLLKFRSMYEGSDASIHREYVTRLIAGRAERQPANENSAGVYKLTQDPRVTPVGALLRKTSLDELPQLINVLQGEMSLVGPRPPVPYEVESYDVWHRRRLLEAKPGMTGLWQVNGRSQVKFDEMVRLDLQYARNWSPWLDIKILLRTPGAVFLGEGAH